MIIQLTPEDLEEIDRIAHIRNDTKKQAWNRRFCQKTDDLEMNIIGLKGEMAFSKLFNAEIDDSVQLSGDNGLDFTLKGRTYQIKATKYRGGALYFNSLKDFKTDFAMVTYPFEDSMGSCVEIGGFTTRKVFKERHSVTNYGYGDRVAMQKKDLYEIEKLIKWIKE
tara:strand:+ start:248 stop:745 length:498 start_codon:yes stop_codon:yes gene_type:complete